MYISSVDHMIPLEGDQITKSMKGKWENTRAYNQHQNHHQHHMSKLNIKGRV